MPHTTRPCSADKETIGNIARTGSSRPIAIVCNFLELDEQLVKLDVDNPPRIVHSCQNIPSLLATVCSMQSNVHPSLNSSLIYTIRFNFRKLCESNCKLTCILYDSARELFANDRLIGC